LAYYGSSDNTFLTYIRFDLSAISSPITDVSLSLTSLLSSTATLEVYGLNNGHADENWSEATTTWNNAPASTQDATGILVSSEITLLKDIFIGTSIGSAVSFHSEELNLFVQSDTNNLVTFILRDNTFGGLSSDATFYSKENTINPDFAPTLYITTVPVPTAIWLFGSALIGLIGAKRKSI
jgi:hypothetical protein